MKNKILIILCMMLFLNFISAVPPVTTVSQFSEGFVVEYPAMEYLKQGTDFDFHFHVFNISNGVNLNSGITCFMHIYNSSGNHIYEGFDNVTSHTFDYSFKPNGLFNEPGLFYYIVQCNNSALGGYTEHAFEVIPTGNSFDISNAVLYGFILALIGMFLFFSINGIKKSTNGSWLIAYICLTYILLYLLVGFLYLMSKYYLFTTPIFESIFYISWFVMGIGFLPFVIVLTLYILGQEAKAVLKKDYMSQGYNEDEARELSKKKHR